MRKCLDKNTYLYLWFLFVLIFFYLNINSAAQAENNPDYGPVFKAETGYRADAGIEGGQGGYAVSQSKVSFTHSILYVHYDRLTYSWHDISRLPFGNGADEPWDALDQLSLSLRYTNTINTKIKYFLCFGVSQSFEEWASRLLDFNFIGGFNYKINSANHALLGFAAWDNEVKTYVIPIVGYRWDRNAVPGGPETGLSATIGYPRTNITYRFTPKVATRLGMSLDRVMYGLARDSVVRRNGYLEAFDIYTGLYLLVVPVKNLNLTMGLRYYSDREFYLYDEDGGGETRYDLDDAWGGVIKLDYYF